MGWASEKEQDIFLQVVEAYYAICEAKKLQKFAEERVLQITEHLQAANDFYEQEEENLRIT